MKGELPWQNIKYKSKEEKYSKIFEIKKKSTEKGGELCNGLPSEMQTILDYVLGLEFTEKPNYSMLKNAFEIILSKLNYFNDLQFDWYNLEFLKNLYKSPIKENKQKKSSNDDNKENIEKKMKENENRKSINEINNKKNEIRININNKQKHSNHFHRNSVNNQRIRQNKSISKTTQNYTITLENNKFKSPSKKRQSVIQEDNNEIKTVKTFLQGKNYQNKKWDEIFNNKENQKIKFRKSNNNIPRIIKK